MNDKVIDIHDLSSKVIPFSKTAVDSRTGNMIADTDILRAVCAKGDTDYDTLLAMRGSITIDWLKRGNLTGDDRYIWSANMPLPYFKCVSVFKAAESMPKDSVQDLVFPDYEFNEYEEILFDICYRYGSAVGLQVVCEKIFEFAKEGDMRAAKLLLEYKKEIDGDNGGNSNALSYVFNMSGKV